jgi:hypothetical protein
VRRDVRAGDRARRLRAARVHIRLLRAPITAALGASTLDEPALDTLACVVRAVMLLRGPGLGGPVPAFWLTK